MTRAKMILIGVAVIVALVVIYMVYPKSPSDRIGGGSTPGSTPVGVEATPGPTTGPTEAPEASASPEVDLGTDENPLTNPDQVDHDHDDEVDPAEGYLPESNWVEEEEEHIHDETAEVADREQWLTASRAFGDALGNVDQPYEQWIAGLAPYVSEELLALYSDPMVQGNLWQATVTSVSPAIEGDSVQQVDLGFTDPHMDCMIVLNPSSETESGWVVTAVVK